MHRDAVYMITRIMNRIFYESQNEMVNILIQHILLMLNLLHAKIHLVEMKWKRKLLMTYFPTLSKELLYSIPKYERKETIP